MKRQPYFYSTLRYTHDIATEEFFVIGVAVFSPTNNILKFKVRNNLGLAGKIVTSDQLKDFRLLMKSLDTKLNRVSSKYTDDLLKTPSKKTLDEILISVFPNDDSALRWSKVNNGLTKDIEQTFNRLYNRYCQKYDHVEKKNRLSDKDVWKQFESKLKRRRLDQYFTTKVISGELDEIEFPFAWKNGAWHCIEPLSFDYADSETIRNKVHKHIGEVSTIRNSKEDFKIYYLTTPPTDKKLLGSYNKAIKLLKTAPYGKLKVYSDSKEQDEFLDSLQNQISANQSSAYA